MPSPSVIRQFSREYDLNPNDSWLHFHEQRERSTMATNPVPVYRADDVLHIPVPPELSGYELVNGELEPVMPVGETHGWLAIRLGVLLEMHVKQHRVAGRVYGEAGFVLGLRRDPERLRGPDVSFVTRARLDRAGGTTRGFIHGIPDLAIEVESKDRPFKLQQRIQDYVEAGVPLVWVIHSETNAATVYRADGSARLLNESESLDGEDVLPGLVIPLRELFDPS